MRTLVRKGLTTTDKNTISHSYLYYYQKIGHIHFLCQILLNKIINAIAFFIVKLYNGI